MGLGKAIGIGGFEFFLCVWAAAHQVGEKLTGTRALHHAS